MKTMYIIFYNIKRNLKRKTSLMYMLLLPIVLILILGTALKSAYTPGDIKKADVYYYSEDIGEISIGFESYLKSDKLKDLINLKKVKNKEEGFISIKSNKRSLFIYRDSNFSQNVKEGKKSNISVYNQRATIQTGIVKNILNVFVNNINSIYVFYIIGVNGKFLDSYNSIIDSPIDINGKFQEQ